MKAPESLVGFLYDLLRDHLPAGVVERLTQVNEANDRGEVIYSNPHLEGYARAVAARLLAEGNDD